MPQRARRVNSVTGGPKARFPITAHRSIHRLNCVQLHLERCCPLTLRILYFLEREESRFSVLGRSGFAPHTFPSKKSIELADVTMRIRSTDRRPERRARAESVGGRRQRDQGESGGGRAAEGAWEPPRRVGVAARAALRRTKVGKERESKASEASRDTRSCCPR